MKILLLTFICGLQALNNDMKESSQLSGEWHTVALASDMPSKIMEGGSLEMFVHKIYINEDGTLSGDFFKKENGECIKFSVSASQGDNGQLKVQYDGDNTININYLDNGCAIFTLYNTKDNQTIRWAELYGRTPNLSDKIKKKFEEICENFGIRKDQIRDLSNDDRCEKLR